MSHDRTRQLAHAASAPQGLYAAAAAPFHTSAAEARRDHELHEMEIAASARRAVAQEEARLRGNAISSELTNYLTNVAKLAEVHRPPRDHAAHLERAFGQLQAARR